MRIRRRFGFAAVLVVVLGLVAGCGQDRGATETTGGTTKATTETSKETTGTTTGESGKVTASYDYSTVQGEIQEKGGQKEAGPYRVGYIVEPAEGWWSPAGGSNNLNLQWREPQGGETNHIEILPYDKETDLLVPGLTGRITLTVLDESGNEVQSQPLQFYYAEFYHYARNFSLPESGTYTLRAEIKPPEFPRHGSEEGEGKVYTEPVTVEFEGVEIETGGS